MKFRIVFVPFASLVFITLLSFACIPKQTQPTQKSNLTAGTVKKEIVKGETMQADVLKLFGSPNLMTMDSDGNEVWNYNRMSYTTTSGSDGGTLIFWWGSRAMTSSTTQSFDLIIVFDKNQIIKDYRVISAAY